MGETTGISWANHSFNPWIGCTKVSEGCKHCYAETFAVGRLGREWGPKAPRKLTGTWSDPVRWNRMAAQAGERRRVFCASLADVFEDHPEANAARPALWSLIRSCPALDWLMLTKRPENFAKMLPEDWGGGWPHVWLGTTVENQAAANVRVPLLRATPARVRFLSCEPLLGPLDLSSWLRRTTRRHMRSDVQTMLRRKLFSGMTDSDGVPLKRAVVEERLWKMAADGIRYIPVGACDDFDPDTGCRGHAEPGIDWCIVGGESGREARPMDLTWARSLLEQCKAAETAFFFKQVSGPRMGMGEDALGEVMHALPVVGGAA